jgi:hypothetical protein
MKGEMRVRTTITTCSYPGGGFFWSLLQEHEPRAEDASMEAWDTGP